MPAPVLAPPARGAPLAEWEAYARQRNCYCGLWSKHPETLEEQGLEPGFCGKCERCGKPGHARHYPGPVPYTGAWCDRCYRVVAAFGWLRDPVGWIVIIAFLVVAWNVVKRWLATAP